MTRPGTQIIARDQAPPRSTPPTQTAPWFVVGATATGPLKPVLVRSLASYEATFGTRSGGTLLYDAVDTFFHEGGTRVYVSAIPTTPSVQATVETSDLDTLTRAELDARAEQAGIEDPSSLPNKEAVTEAIRDAVGGGEEVEAAAAPTPTDVKTALDRFTTDLGPGQVSAPGITDSATHGNLLDHADTHNRVAILDSPPGAPTAASLVALATALHTVQGRRFGALFGPWAKVPGIAGGTIRDVPYSAIEAGIIARNDASGLDPNEPASGIVNGLSVFATDVAVRYTDLEYEQMNDAGVDMARLIYGGVATYGYRTVTDPTADQLWRNFGNSRLHMAIYAQADAIAERYVFSQMDGRGKTIAHFGSELAGMLARFWDADALFGATAEEAFQVDVGSSVNTPTTIANGELHAVLKVKMSPFAELVVIEIVRVALTEAIAA